MNIGVLIEGLVAALLLLTIAYCMILNRRLTSLKADEKSFKARIAELVAATETAERSVAEFKIAAHASEATLGERLRAAERLSAEIARQIHSGETLMNCLAGGMVAARTGDPSGAGHAPADPRAMAAAAQAIADRARQFLTGRAA